MAEPAAAPLTLRFFGPFEAHVNGAPLPRLRSLKGLWLLGLLALHTNKEVERAWLTALLWPDSTECAAFANLRCSLKDLRRALGAESVRLRSPTVRTLRLDLTGAAVDVVAFDAAIARGDTASLREAARLYRGPLLERCSEEWVFLERRAREEAYLAGLETLAAEALAAGDPGAATGWLRQAVGIDPLRETAQRSLMQALAVGGNYGAALLVYRELRQRLHREINAEPDPETVVLFEEIRAAGRRKAAAGSRAPATGIESGPGQAPISSKHSGGAADTVFSSTSKSGGPHRAAGAEGSRPAAGCGSALPKPVSRFIGRTQEMAEIHRFLRNARLLTLAGAGGCGKSRLALEAASRVAARFPDGIWWVELAALSDPALVPHAVAAALGAQELPGRPLLGSLVTSLRPKAALLLLDNCEHLLDGCAHLAETLLQACPHLQILATSREALGIGGEQCYPVPPLTLPPAGPAVPPATLLGKNSVLLASEAVQLFLDRAALHSPGFSLSPTNAAAIAQICRQLDGIPLAVELAAARVKSLPVAQIAAGLDDSLRLLTGGSRTALPRQQTLRASIDWSYALLTEPERALLRRLSVFVGGWTQEAAEAVRGDGRDQGGGMRDERNGSPSSLAPTVLDRLTSLVEKSLVIYGEPSSLAQGQGEADSRWPAARYRMLEMVRQYARERLEESGEAGETESRHARFFLSLAERAEPEMFGPRQHGWLGRLEVEHDNLRAAMERAAANGEIEAGLRLGTALQQFWHVRGYYREGRDRLVRLLSLPGRAGTLSLRARALGAAGRMANHQGDLVAARSLLQEGLLIWRRLADECGIARALASLASVAFQAGDYDAARPLYQESLAIRRRLNRELEVADVLNNIGLTAAFQNDYAAARELLSEALVSSRRLGHELNTSYALNNLGIVLLRQGDSTAATSLFAESLRLKSKLGNRGGLAWGLVGLAEVAALRGEATRAAKLYGAAAAIRTAVGSLLPPYFDDTVAETRAALGEAAFADAWAEGQRLSLEQACAYALEQVRLTTARETVEW